MLSVFQRSARMLASATVLVAVAGTAVAMNGSSEQAMGRSERLQQAAALIDQGLVVEAKSELVSLRRSSADKAEQARILELIAQADRKLRSLNEVDVSLQKAALAIKHGDLRLADSHANAARRSDTATSEQRQRASMLLDESALLRDELAPMVGPALDQAIADFGNGHYAEAKAGLASVSRSGVTLSSRQNMLLLSYQDKLVDLERANGRPFDLDYIPLGVLRAAAVTGTAAATGASDSGDAGISSPEPEPVFPAATSEPAPTPTPAPTPSYTTPSQMEEMTPVETTPPVPAAEVTTTVVTSEPADDAWESDDQPLPEPVPVATVARADTRQEQMREVDPTPAPAPSQPSASQPAPAPAPAPAGDDLFEQAARADAERVLVEADLAFEAGRLSEAINKYTQATTTFARYLTVTQVSAAEARLREARARAGLDRAGALQDTVASRDIQRQQTEAEVDNLVRQAEQALTAGNTEAARDKAAEARLRWKEAYNRGLFAEEAFAQRQEAIEALVRRINVRETELRDQEAISRAENLRQEKIRQESRAKAELETRISESIDRISALQAELKYEEALQVVDDVLALDRNNPAGLLLKDIISDIVHYREWERTLNTRSRSYSAHSLENLKATIAPLDIVDFPADWPDISFRRGEVQSYMESPENRRVLAMLEKQRIPASFTDNTIEDVLAFIGTVTNLNMDIDWDALALIGIEKDATVSLSLREIPARVVLDRVLQKVSPDDFSRAAWAVEDGILVISSEQALRKKTFIQIYDVRDLIFYIPNFRQVPELDLDSVLNQGRSGGGGGGGGIFRDDEEEEEDDADRELEQLEKLLDIIQTNVDFEGWRDNGGDTGIVQELNGNLIITNTASNHRSIQGLLSQLREIRNMQISVEARFLAVSQDFFEKIGFDVDIYFNAQNNQFRGVQRQLEAFGAGTLANEGLPVVPRDLAGARTGSTNGYTFNPADGTFSFTNTPWAVPAPDPLSIIPVQSGSDVLAEVLTEGSAFATSVLAANPALAIAGTFLDDVQVDFLVEATQADRRSVVLTAPRLTFTNGRTANIYVATTEPFVTDLTPVVGTSAVAFDPTLTPVNSGFTLLVRGVVSADRRYVTMALEASVAEIVGRKNADVSAVVGGTGGSEGGGIATGQIESPIVQVTRVQTGVTVPDQGTILLGGQRLSNEIEVETGVPVLSKIPIINRFFTNRTEVKEEQTLLILLKPTILIQNEEEEKAFPGLLDKLQDPFAR